MLSLKRISSALLLLPLCSVAVAGCDPKGDTKPDNADTADGFGGCIDTPTVIGSVDEVTALGFSAADVLAVAEGEHVSPIFWHTPDAEFGVETGPETGEGTLTVNVSHGGGEIRYVVSVPEDEGEFGELEGSGCVDRLEIDVDATIASSGGALAESMPVTLMATSDLLARFQAKLDLDEIAGSLFVDTDIPDATIPPVSLDVGVSAYGLSGSLSGMIEIHTGDVVGAGFFSLATFPSAEPRCSPGQLAIPYDLALEGFSAADGLGLVNQAWIYQLTWQGGEPTAMTLTAEHDGGEICADVSPGEGLVGTLHFGAVVTLTTEAGVDASFPVSVSAEPNDLGELGQVHMWNEAPYGSLVEAAAFAETYGEFGVDVAGYDLAGIEFAGAFAPSDLPGSADGSLTVLAGTDPNCSDVPGEPCEGIDVVELARAEWGNTGVQP